MRIRIFLSLASLSFMAAGVGIQACGGSSDTAETSTDSGVPSEGGAKDVAVADAVDAAPECDPNKDFLADIPDASLADGASTTSACVGCTKAKCSAEVAKCGADCTCQQIAGKALDCFAKTQDVLGCAGKFAAVPKVTQDIGVSLFGCINKECKTACAAAAFTDAGDGGQ